MEQSRKSFANNTNKYEASVSLSLVYSLFVAGKLALKEHKENVTRTSALWYEIMKADEKQCFRLEPHYALLLALLKDRDKKFVIPSLNKILPGGNTMLHRAVVNGTTTALVSNISTFPL